MGEGAVTNEAELLDCMRRIGKGLIASGSSVGVVENTLTEIALAYQVKCEIVALPNILMIKIGPTVQAMVDIAVQRLSTLWLDQISELMVVIDQVKQKKLAPGEAVVQVDRIMAKPPRFNSGTMVLGYVLSCLGLTLLFRPEPLALLVTGSAGVLVGLMILWSRRWPRFALLLPVIAAAVVSTLIFSLTKQGLIYGTVNLIIPPLITFLPGALLTTGMIELASMHMISGSSRLIYGATSLLLLFVGIAAGLNVTNLPPSFVYAYEPLAFPWWAPFLGTLLFGLGTFIRLSGANRDLFWMLLVLYIAMLSQSAGEYFINSYFGAFLAATLMTVSSELIARSPRRTPTLVAQMLAFWFLVPGARGLLSVTSILSENIQSVLIGLGEMILLIIAIAVGVLLGTLVTSPDKFIAVRTNDP